MKILLENLYPLTRKSFMFYFYAFQSLKDKDLYFGYTNNLQERTKEHNAGRVPSTKDRRPLELVYYKAYRSEKDARERERQIKRRAKAYISLKRRFKNSLFK
jgi:putative endonuclease